MMHLIFKTHFFGHVLFIFILLTCGVKLDARVIPISEGENTISQAVLTASSKDTLLLITNGGTYHETDATELHIPLTIMADSTLSVKPTWTTKANRHIKVYQDLYLKGVFLDGQNQTAYAIRSYAPKPNTIIIDNCIIANFTHDGITDNDVPIDTCIVRNTVFHDIRMAALEFRTSDMCRNLIVEHCTFYRLGEHAIHLAKAKYPATVRISHITIYNSNGGIYLINVDDATISNSIITNCRIYAIRSLKSIVISNMCTFQNVVNYEGTKVDSTCFDADPLFFDPENSNFSLLPHSPCITTSNDDLPLGDVRWTGSATVRAGRLHLLRRWGTIGAYIFLSLGSTLLLILYVKRRERLKLHAIQQQAHTLEALVQERTHELQHTQSQLLQSQKLEAVGQLAGGMAHDFNNQLAIMQGYLEIIFEEIALSDIHYPRLQHIYRAVEKSTSLTHQLLLFSHNNSVEKHPVHLNQGLTDLAEMLRRLLGEDIHIHLDLESHLWAIFANQDNLDQVVTNLSINARDAMPEGGEICIQTRNVTIDETDAQNHPLSQIGNFICLIIRDTGMGMDAEVKEHIFEPFYTTKPKGKGTGLGLSVVYGIVQAHEGWIVVDSELDKGTQIKIYFPAVLASQETENIHKDIPAPQKGSGQHVLIIEDEIELKDMLQKTLIRQGYQTSDSGTLQEAQTVFQEQKTAIDLILSDLVLPDGRSTKFILQCLEQDPNIGVVLITGYIDNPSDLEIIRQKNWPLIQKPMSMPVLLYQINKVLSKRLEDTHQ